MSHSRAVVWDTPGVRTQRAEVDQLPDPARAQAHESPEARQVANLAQPAHVTLDVGLEVVAERLSRVEFVVENPGIESGVDDVVYRVARAHTLPFGERERQQPEQRRATGERLADGAGKAELLAAGEHEKAVAANFVGKHLEIGEERRNVLDLVDDGALS